MVSKRMKKSLLLINLIVICTFICTSNAGIATFEDMNLPDQSYWNGSDGSGPFTSGQIIFSNNYDSAWQSWDGFSYSNINDVNTVGFDGQFNAITGIGQGETSNYAICCVGFSSLPVITLSGENAVYGLYVTNNNYAYYSMLNGDTYSKKFGGKSGNDKDWFKLTITGKDAKGNPTGTVDFYLADYRFDDNNLDYIVDTWEYIDLTKLGKVKTLEFNLSSSDTGIFGMNTPGYFAMDTVISQSEPPIEGPYTEAGINGYVNPLKNNQQAGPEDSQSVINPIFKGWASKVVDYYQAPGVDFLWSDPNAVLGPVTGDNMDIFSLGDLSREQVQEGEKSGWITVTFGEPFGNANGYDFAVFENGMVSESTTSAGSVKGELLAELAFVEVSSDGENFVRFPSVSLNEKPGNMYSTVNPKLVYNLAGKHPNAYNVCTGTPFDLQELANLPDVVSGLVDINNISFVRVVDIPGTGDFYDNAVLNTEPNTDPNWAPYANNHPIFDEWNTSLVPYHPSGGFDLEAVGVLKEQQYSADIDLNGIVDGDDFTIMVSAWHSHFGQSNWNSRCDLAEPKDNYIDDYDLDVFISQWLENENWNN
jgi:hypothetical protein